MWFSKNTEVNIQQEYKTGSSCSVCNTKHCAWSVNKLQFVELTLIGVLIILMLRVFIVQCEFQWVTIPKGQKTAQSEKAKWQELQRTFL